MINIQAENNCKYFIYIAVFPKSEDVGDCDTVEVSAVPDGLHPGIQL